MTSDIRIDPILSGTARLKRCDWPNCGAACCIYGAWVDKFHAKDILKHAAEIAPHMEPDRQSPFIWFDGQEESDDHALSGRVMHTSIIPNADHLGGISCIFLRQDHKCALQSAAEAIGEHPWRFKPFYCILHPLDMTDEHQITLDDPELLLKEPTSCLQPSNAETRLTDLFKEELDYLLGKRRK